MKPMLSLSQEIRSSHDRHQPRGARAGPALRLPRVVGLAFHALVRHNVEIHLRVLTTIVAEYPNLTNFKVQMLNYSP